jgi:hypothetical protein
MFNTGGAQFATAGGFETDKRTVPAPAHRSTTTRSFFAGNDAKRHVVTSGDDLIDQVNDVECPLRVANGKVVCLVEARPAQPCSLGKSLIFHGAAGQD